MGINKGFEKKKIKASQFLPGSELPITLLPWRELLEKFYLPVTQCELGCSVMSSGKSLNVHPPVATYGRRGGLGKNEGCVSH